MKQGRSDHWWSRATVASAGFSGRCRLAIFACGLLLAFLQLAPAAMAAPGTHIFDAALSLTGGTTVSSLDPIPDPGPTHPPEAFSGETCAPAVDSAGDTYVASRTDRIDIFDPEGKFIQEITNTNRPCNLAVDSKGTLYAVQDFFSEAPGVVRYVPDEYPPTPATNYGSPAFVDTESGALGLAVNTANDHLFVPHGDHVVEYSSAEEGNAVVKSDLGLGTIHNAHSIAVDSTTGNIFVASVCNGCNPIPSSTEPFVSVVYVFNSAGTLIHTIDGSETAEGGFTSAFGKLSVAVDEQTGEVFIADQEGSKLVYRFVAEGGYHWVSDPELEGHSYKPEMGVAVSNGSSAPTRGNVYVTAQGPPGHMYAFIPSGEVGAPIITETAAENATTSEVELVADVNPNGAPTDYHFEYVDAATHERDIEELGAGHGFDHAATAGAGTLAAGHQPLRVSTLLEGLPPGTSFRFRVVASNCKEGEARPCETEGEVKSFATYPLPPALSPCPNEALRVGPSASLPDCRAYELVTPSNTNGRVPTAAFLGFAGAVGFPTELATEDGSSLLFMTSGGALPIPGGNGVQDGYEAVRSPSSGWRVHSADPSGEQSQTPNAGGASADHQFWFWSTGSGTDHGSLVIGGQTTNYVRLPDGSFRLVGEGPLGTDPRAEAYLMTPGGTHMIFSSTVSLAEGASPEGTRTIYDRQADGTVHVVSLVGPSDEAPGAGAEVKFQGAAANGETVAFTVTSGGVTTLYVRKTTAGVTIPVTTGTTTFAGLSNDGGRLTYLKGGNLFSFDVEAATTQPIGLGGQSVPVNVSADGSDVYFVSPKILSGGGPVGGQQNFYVWDSATNSISFIGVLTNGDVEGESFPEGHAYGLGQWIEGLAVAATGTGGPANDPSRTTPDGGTIVFESHAKLTSYDSAGRSEVYRYVVGGTPALTCLSCSPALLPAVSDAHLQVVPRADEQAVAGGRTPVNNVTADGRTVVFQTGDALVPDDVDQTADVYEWKVAGTGNCSTQPGCLALISSGHSSAPNYLYSVNRSSHDIFFASADRLLAADQDSTVSIYDARVEGGFPEQEAVSCSGEECKGQPGSPPPMAAPGSTAATGSGNLPAGKKCGKGKRKIRRGGKVRCVRRHQNHHHHKRHRHHAGSKAGGSR